MAEGSTLLMTKLTIVIMALQSSTIAFVYRDLFDLIGNLFLESFESFEYKITFTS